MKVKKYFSYIAIALLLALLVRTFIIEFYYIPEENGDIKTGIISVNKLKYGGRFPITAFSFPFFADKIPLTNIRSYLDIRLSYFRFFGFSEISRKDKILFNSTEEPHLAIDRRSLHLSECIALAGDTLLFDGDRLLVNRKIRTKISAQEYRFWIKGSHSHKRKTLKLQNKNLINFIGAFEFSELDRLFEKISNDSLIQAFKIKNKTNSSVLLSDKNILERTLIVVPKKGIEMKLNSTNFHFLLPILIENEKAKLEIKGKKLFINNIETKVYTFSQDYFLIKKNSGKCYRYEFIPESHIVGIVN